MGGDPGSTGAGSSISDLKREAARSRRRATRDPAAAKQLATSLDQLSRALAAADRRGEAIDCVQEAVAIERARADGSTQGLRRLALLQNNLSLWLRTSQRTAEALAVRQEQVSVCRRLDELGDQKARSMLAPALTYLSSSLADARREPEALAAAEESVGIYRWLSSPPAAATPLWALAMLELVRRLLANDRIDDAVIAAQEASERLRIDARTDPAAAGPSLSRALEAEAIARARAGDEAGSAVVTEEALGWLDWLDAADPARYAIQRSLFLRRRADTLAAIGSPETLDAQRAAVRAMRLANDRSGGRHTRDLLRSLTVLLVRIPLGTSELEWGAACDEATGIARQLARDVAGGADADLAELLARAALAVCAASDRARPAAATELATDAVAVARSLPIDDPRRARVLFDALSALVLVLVAGERDEDALSLAAELTSLPGDLDDPANTTARSKLATAHADLALAAQRLGRLDVALAHCDESVRLFREQVLVKPSPAAAQLGQALATRAGLLTAAGRLDEAVTASREAVAQADQAGSGPTRPRWALALVLARRAGVRTEEGRFAGALEDSTDAVEQLEALAGLDNIAVGQLLILVRVRMAMALHRLGRTREAITSSNETAAMARAQAAEDSDETSASLLGTTLVNLSEYLESAADLDTAASVAQEAIEWWSGSPHRAEVVLPALESSLLHALIAAIRLEDDQRSAALAARLEEVHGQLTGLATDEARMKLADDWARLAACLRGHGAAEDAERADAYARQVRGTQADTT